MNIDHHPFNGLDRIVHFYSVPVSVLGRKYHAVQIYYGPVSMLASLFMLLLELTGRTTSTPISAHRLIVDKVQELRSGILTYTGLVLLQMNVEMRVRHRGTKQSPKNDLQPELGSGLPGR